MNRKYLHNKDFSDQDSDDLKELIDTITSKTLVDDIKDEEEKELLSELLATTIDIKLEQELSEKEINKLYDEKNVVNNNLDKFNDLFIAEMGAFKVGEIATTCKLVNTLY